jgi:hypothetical protein
MTYTRDISNSYSFPYRHSIGSYQAAAGNRTGTYTGQRTGTKVVGWRELLAKGSNAASPYQLDLTTVVESSLGSASLQAYSRESTPPYKVTTYTQGMTGLWANLPSSISHLSTSLVKADSMALTKIYKKIREEQQRMNSPAVIAELGDVIRQFGKPFDALIDLTNRRLNRLELASRGLSGSTSFRKIKWLEIVASTYLEYSFGLAPVISDTRAAAEALARWQFELTGEQRFRAKVVSRGLDENSSNSSTGNNDVGGTGSWFKAIRTDRTHTQHKVQYVVGLNSTPIADFGSNERLLQLLGFNHANWIPALWEVVPWTWLIDYFSNISDILNASVTNTTSISWIVKTVIQDTLSEIEMHVDPGATRSKISAVGATGSGSGSLGSIKIRKLTMSRTLPASLNVPALTFTIPVEAKQLANMAAVLLARRPTSSALWLT